MGVFISWTQCFWSCSKKLATKIPIEKITLHVGLGTFEPLQNSNIAENKLHTEFYNLKKETLQLLP